MASLNRADYLKSYLIIESDDCVEWPFAKSRNGYGNLKYQGKNWVTSNLLCMWAHGPAPGEKYQAAHSCGNRACLNPNHLRWVTPLENGQDKVIHGTSARGHRARSAKLTDSEVRTIRKRFGKDSDSKIARDHGVSRRTIRAIRIGETWAWLDQTVTKSVPFNSSKVSHRDKKP